MTTQYRQGDVLVEFVESYDLSNAKKVDSGEVILAHGEATGHMHVIQEDIGAMLFDVGLGEGERVLKLTNDAVLRHLKGGKQTGEHGEIPLPKGFYRVLRQEEYHPSKNRFVQD